MNDMSPFHRTIERPNKVRAIVDAISEGFQAGCFKGPIEKGIVYHTLGGIKFNDVKIFYNVFGDTLKHALSYEYGPNEFQRAEREAKKLQTSGLLGGVTLKVLQENILESDLRHVPRDGMGVVLFLDLTEVFGIDHQAAIKRWIFGHSLVPGDVIYVTSSLPPWELIRNGFRAGIEPILKGYGATATQLANKQYWKVEYIPVLFDHFAERWRCHGHSRRGFRHFYGSLYRDSQIEMAINGFQVS